MLALLLAMTLACEVAAGDAVGYAAAVRPEAQASLGGGAMCTPAVGAAVSMQDRFRTGAGGRIDLVFRDGSAITIGPNSELTLDRFVFDREADRGELAVSVAKGVFRFIGGRISKTRPVRFRAPTAVIGIRGGMALLNVQAAEDRHAAGQGNGALSRMPAEATSVPSQARPRPEIPDITATFLYGIDLTVQTATGRQRMTRPGFSIATGRGGTPELPAPALQEALDDVARALQ